MPLVMLEDGGGLGGSVNTLSVSIIRERLTFDHTVDYDHGGVQQNQELYQLLYKNTNSLLCQTFEWKTHLADIMSTNHHHLCCQPFWSTIIVYYCLKVVPEFYHIHLQVVSKWSQNCLRVL